MVKVVDCYTFNGARVTTIDIVNRRSGWGQVPLFALILAAKSPLLFTLQGSHTTFVYVDLRPSSMETIAHLGTMNV